MREQCSAVIYDGVGCFRLAATSVYYTNIDCLGKLHSSCLMRIFVIYTMLRVLDPLPVRVHVEAIAPGVTDQGNAIPFRHFNGKRAWRCA